MPSLREMVEETVNSEAFKNASEAWCRKMNEHYRALSESRRTADADIETRLRRLPPIGHSKPTYKGQW